MSGRSGESAASPLFLDSARDLAKRLEAVGTADTALLARRARALESELSAWATNMPTTSERHKAIERLLELQREALDLLASQG